MKDILSEIVANKRFEVDLQKRTVTEEVLQDHLAVVPPCRSLRQALLDSPTGIIAEFKRRSPSKGWISEHANPAEVVPSYAKAGAAALSILTDTKFFGGSLGDVKAVRSLVGIPILRKDFIVDEYQLYQAKLVGADAVLLIAAVLPYDEFRALLSAAHRLNLEVLLEIHGEDELRYVSPDVDVVGVNNRNLGTFFTDVDNSLRMAELLPSDIVAISESGISDVPTMLRLRRAGYRGFLIGESFMRGKNPAKVLQQFAKEALR
jgi:indole-3-glycerol phosphate synthase